MKQVSESKESSLDLEGCDDFVRFMDKSYVSSLGSENKGRWTNQEHNDFIKMIIGTECCWKSIKRQLEGTRTMSQIKSHAQKFFRTYKKRSLKYQNLIETDAKTMSEKTKYFIVQEMFNCSALFAEELIASFGFFELIENFNKFSGLKKKYMEEVQKRTTIILVNFCKVKVPEEKIKSIIASKLPNLSLEEADVKIFYDTDECSCEAKLENSSGNLDLVKA